MKMSRSEPVRNGEVSRISSRSDPQSDPQSDEKRQKVLDALYAWAEADALTQTKPCAKNGNILRSCSEWNQSDGQDLSDKKDHSTVQMHMMHIAYGYYLMLADFNSDDPKHKKIQSWINKFFKWNSKRQHNRANEPKKNFTLQTDVPNNKNMG